MVICPVCNKENNDEEYCTDCGTKLVDVKKIHKFEFNENKDISNVNELNRYYNLLNDKINQQKKFLDELNNKYETISEINDENDKLRLKIEKLERDNESISEINDENDRLRMKIENLERKNEKISLDLKQQKQVNSQLQARISSSKNGSDFSGVIRDIFGSNNKNMSDANYCPNCGYKLI